MVDKDGHVIDIRDKEGQAVSITYKYSDGRLLKISKGKFDDLDELFTMVTLRMYDTTKTPKSNNYYIRSILNFDNFRRMLSLNLVYSQNPPKRVQFKSFVFEDDAQYNFLERTLLALIHHGALDEVRFIDIESITLKDLARRLPIILSNSLPYHNSFISTGKPKDSAGQSTYRQPVPDSVYDLKGVNAITKRNANAGSADTHEEKQEESALARAASEIQQLKNIIDSLKSQVISKDLVIALQQDTINNLNLALAFHQAVPMLAAVEANQAAPLQTNGIRMFSAAMVSSSAASAAPAPAPVITAEEDNGRPSAFKRPCRGPNQPPA